MRYLNGLFRLLILSILEGMPPLVIRHETLGYVSMRQLAVLAALPGKEFFGFASPDQRKDLFDGIRSGDDRIICGILAMCGRGFTLCDESFEVEQ